ncbi:dTDP-4-dehydrorhamnose 3,5-epimerase [bacterium]|nr:dTDP-4-dehydrorhamnose 3,5-epimerase [bacterium]
MILTPTKIQGAYLVELEKLEDDRGFFARSWCAETFRKAGLNGDLVQCSVSYNRKRGTLRGMHWQEAPHGEAKLVRCIKGEIYDVIYDLRPESSTYGRWQAFTLDASSRQALYVPEGVAHGFQTLTDDTELFYQMSTAFEPSASRTLAWNDPKAGIDWPISEPILSEKDRSAR